jgi:hypothetical protein
MKSKNWHEPGWEIVKNDDHRSLLSKIVSSKASMDIVYQLCSPWLHLIVEELHFGSQKTSALTLLPNEVSRISKEYLSWLKDVELWQQLSDHWSTQTRGPWSMPLFLATGYQEFLVTQYPDLGVKESSLSYRRAIVEYSTKSNIPSNRVVGALAEQLVESFTAWTNTLNDTLRTCYQLHLEGMLENEIGAILELDPEEVHRRIQAAKAELGIPHSEAV